MADKKLPPPPNRSAIPGPSRNTAPNGRPKMDGRATYHGLYTVPKETHPRYPNYIPELRAQRESVSKHEQLRREAIRNQVARDHAHEMALNRIVMNKVKRIAMPPPPTHRDHQLFGLHPGRSRHVTHAREVLSIFRCQPKTFTDDDSPLLQLDLIRHGPKPRRDKSDITTIDMDD